MKRWGVILAIALTLLLKNAESAKAQVVVVTNPTLITDPVICPDGCSAIGIAQANNSATEFNDMGNIYLDSGGNLLPVPGGYSASTIAAFSQAVTPSTDDVAGGGGGKTPAGALGTQYADGRYAGFYQAPNGKYYPIDASKKATRTWKGKGQEQPALNCPDGKSLLPRMTRISRIHQRKIRAHW